MSAKELIEELQRKFLEELVYEHSLGRAEGIAEERARWVARVEQLREVRALALSSGGNVYGYDDAIAIMEGREP